MELYEAWRVNIKTCPMFAHKSLNETFNASNKYVNIILSSKKNMHQAPGKCFVLCKLRRSNDKLGLSCAKLRASLLVWLNSGICKCEIK